MCVIPSFPSGRDGRGGANCQNRVQTIRRESQTREFFPLWSTATAGVDGITVCHECATKIRRSPRRRRRTLPSRRRAGEGRVYTAARWALRIKHRLHATNGNSLEPSTTGVRRKARAREMHAGRSYRGSRPAAAACRPSTSARRWSCTAREGVCRRTSRSLREGPSRRGCQKATAWRRQSSRGFSRQGWGSGLARADIRDTLWGSPSYPVCLNHLYWRASSILNHPGGPELVTPTIRHSPLQDGGAALQLPLDKQVTFCGPSRWKFFLQR